MLAFFVGRGTWVTKSQQPPPCFRLMCTGHPEKGAAGYVWMVRNWPPHPVDQHTVLRRTAPPVSLARPWRTQVERSSQLVSQSVSQAPVDHCAAASGIPFAAHCRPIPRQTAHSLSRAKTASELSDRFRRASGRRVRWGKERCAPLIRCHRRTASTQSAGHAPPPGDWAFWRPAPPVRCAQFWREGSSSRVAREQLYPP